MLVLIKNNYKKEVLIMNSWVLTTFIALNLAMLLIAGGTYLCRSAKKNPGRGVKRMDFYEIFNWCLLIVTFAVMIGIGFLSSRKVKDSDEGGFLLAGRSLGAFVGASTIVATGFSGWGLWAPRQ